MKFRNAGFNLNFLLLLAAVVCAGCGSAEKRKLDKELSVLRLHIETNPDNTPYTTTISVLRSSPMRFSIYSNPFLDERSVLEAAVIDQERSFAIQVLFDSRGRFNLESITQANRGLRIAVFSEFGSPRWLAAPRITHTLKDAIFTFTPDATREEAERIVRGLNNSRRKQSRLEHFPEKQ